MTDESLRGVVASDEVGADEPRATEAGFDVASPDDLEHAVGAEDEFETEPALETGSAPAPTQSGEHGHDAEASSASEPAPAVGPTTVARFLADSLRRAGVRWAFTVPGESFLPFLETLEGAGIHVVATRHEGAAAFMAEAHGQLTGRPAVVVGTRAVGATNMAIGIHTAFADSSPMFAVVGGVDRPSLGREAFQEVDLAGTVGQLAKAAFAPLDPIAAAHSISDAVLAATTGRPGPIVLAIAEDLFDAGLEPSDLPPPSRGAGALRPTDDEVRSVVRLLAGAVRPVILAGAGVLRARTSNDLLKFAELLRVPVVAAWRRGDVVSNDHPLYLGMTGYGAAPSVLARLEAADAILVIGSRLNEIATHGWRIPVAGTRWAHVDLVPERPSPTLAPADIRIASDARAFLRSAVTFLETRAVLDAASVDARVAANAADRAAWEADSIVDGHPWSGPGVHPGRIVAALRRLLPDDAIVTTDAGSFAGWLGRGFRFRRPGTFLGPTSGAMGYGLPAAIAAGLVHRDRAVVALTGDGGLGMTLAEIETAVRMGLRTVVLVFDNEAYGMIGTYQDGRPGGAHIATDLGPIDFAAVARGLGARGARAETDEQFEAALRQALVADLPTVIHLPMSRAWTSVDARP